MLEEAKPARQYGTSVVCAYLAPSTAYNPQRMLVLRPEAFVLLQDEPPSADLSPQLLLRVDGKQRAFVPLHSASADTASTWRLFVAAQPLALSEVLRALEASRCAHVFASDGETALIFVRAEALERAITALTRAGVAVQTPSGEHVPIHCSWRLPEGKRANATYLAEVITYDAAHDRWLMRLKDVRVDPSVPEATRALIMEQIGRWVWVPSEARQGLALPLKYETLTGRVRWFHVHDPREAH